MRSQIAISGERYGITSHCNHRRFDRSRYIFLCHVFAAKKGKQFQYQAETTIGRARPQGSGLTTTLKG